MLQVRKNLINLSRNEKEPTAMVSSFKFGKYEFDGPYRSKAIFRITPPAVNHSVQQCTTPDNRSARYAASCWLWLCQIIKKANLKDSAVNGGHTAYCPADKWNRKVLVYQKGDLSTRGDSTRGKGGSTSVIASYTQLTHKLSTA